MSRDWEAKKFGENFLDDIIDWIVDNFEIDELYDKSKIEDWLEENSQDYGYILEE